MNAQNEPRFSIVIPTYNRPERLAECLESLTHLDYPCDRFEVIVVDDGSPTPLQPIAAEFEGRLPLRYLRQENTGPAGARNAGAAAARGEYLAFTDDDCRPAPEWLAALEGTLQEHPEALVGGRTENALPENLYSSASQSLVDYLYDYYNSTSGEAVFFTSNNFALPQALFQKIGGFDTSFPLAAGEDREFCDRWRHQGFSMYYAPAARIRHAHTLTLASYWRQHFNYGRGAYHFHQARSKRDSEPIAVEPLTFYWRLLGYPFSQQSHNRTALISSGLFFLSQVGTVAGFFWERRQSANLTPQPSN